MEDEEDILSMVRLRLTSRGYDVLAAYTGEDGLETARSKRPDLILLDLMLPGIGGFEVLKTIRSEQLIARIPVLIVSALGEESDVVLGLELGADDYVSKPFNMTVLLARINALLRRANIKEDEPNTISVGPLTIDADRYQVFLDSDQISLTATEYRLLLTFALSKGRVLTRNQLIDRAIGSDALVTDRTIDVHLAALRSKLGHAREMIETVRGVGYRLASSGGN